MNDRVAQLLRGSESQWDAAPHEAESLRFRLVPASDLEVRQMDWLVSDLFESDSLVNIYGQPGSAKSFTAVDLSCCIATGQNYHGREVKQGPAVYIAGEGFNGISRRLEAWSIVNDYDRAELPLFVSNMPAALTDRNNLSMVLQAIKSTGETPSLVVIDTLARNFGPADENSTQDMTAFVHACDEIRQVHQCTVMLIHHTGHGDQKRARGSSVLDGAMDSSFRVKKDSSDTILVECTKQKDALEPDPFAFKFHTVELGFDNDDGSQATSAVLRPCDMQKPEPKKPQGKHQLKALAALADLYRGNRSFQTVID